MIARLFKKSTPLNYALIIIGLIFFFFLYHIGHVTDSNGLIRSIFQFSMFAIILGSLFLVNFIIKRNGLSKDSTYTVLFYLIFMMFFPAVFNKPALLLSNFFILLSLRRMVSLHSLKTPKEKIFDASIWIFVAAAFHFWAIIFIVLVFISILFHAARDYRNWLLPFIAFVTIAVIFILLTLIFDKTYFWNLINSATFDFKINYFTNNFQNAALSIYATAALFFMISMVASLSSRPLILHTSYKKIISAFFIGVIIYVVSPFKSNDLLVFTFAPLAILATNYVEYIHIKWKKDAVIYTLLVFGICAFAIQL